MIVLPLALLPMLGLAEAASACTCAPMTPKSIERANAAAVVRLDQVEPVTIDPDFPEFGPADYHYTVREVLASRRPLAEGDTLTIRSEQSGAACGLPNREGKKYGLLLYRHKGKWTSSLCSSTSPKHLRQLARESDADTAGSRRQSTGCT